jgi:hypothetical protein
VLPATPFNIAVALTCIKVLPDACTKVIAPAPCFKYDAQKSVPPFTVMFIALAPLLMITFLPSCFLLFASRVSVVMLTDVVIVICVGSATVAAVTKAVVAI